MKQCQTRQLTHEYLVWRIKSVEWILFITIIVIIIVVVVIPNAFKFSGCPCSTVVLSPTKFQNDLDILTPYLAGSKCYGLTSFRIVKRVPGCHNQIMHLLWWKGKIKTPGDRRRENAGSWALWVNWSNITGTNIVIE